MTKYFNTKEIAEAAFTEIPEGWTPITEETKHGWVVDAIKESTEEKSYGTLREDGFKIFMGPALDLKEQYDRAKELHRRGHGHERQSPELEMIL